MDRSPRIEIAFCTRCRWMLRATWVAQELFTTFPDDIGEIALVPGPAGAFDIHLDDTLLWSRKDEGRFPDLKELKQRVRDHVDPNRDLGHSDKK